MPIPQPNLDDRRFKDLAEELRSLIPRYCPDWTDHNPSDPGITVLELFAWLGEGLIYRLNRIPEKSRREFLALLLSTDAAGASVASPVPLDELRAKVRQALSARFRAITADDFEHLVLDRFGSEAARARCLGDTDLEEGVEKTGHVSVVVVPYSPDPRPVPDAGLLSRVKVLLDERRLVALRLHVVGPSYVDASIAARVAAKAGENPAEVQAAIIGALGRFLDPLPVDGGEGWPFGRDLHVSEVCQVIEGVAGVDHVEKVTLSGGGTAAGNRVPVPPDSLIHFDAGASDIRVTALRGV